MMRASLSRARCGLLLAALCLVLTACSDEDTGGGGDALSDGSDDVGDDGTDDGTDDVGDDGGDDVSDDGGGDDDGTGDDGSDDDGTGDDGGDDCGDDDGGHGGDPPSLECDPADATLEELCACAADIVCDQIRFCLDADQLAAKPEDWSPRESCVAVVLEDCLEDAASEPEDYLPVDFPQCVQDVADAECAAFGTFDDVSEDFPLTCENFRALDTGLGIQQ
jgi:hypothetical protein